MNIRRGLGRIYLLASWLILLGVVIVAAFDMPSKQDIDRSYAYEIAERIPGNVSPFQLDPEKECQRWSFLLDDVDAYCRGREIAIQGLFDKRVRHIVERLIYLLGTAAVLYAARKAAGWVADGFSTKK